MTDDLNNAAFSLLACALPVPDGGFLPVNSRHPSNSKDTRAFVILGRYVAVQLCCVVLLTRLLHQGQRFFQGGQPAFRLPQAVAVNECPHDLDKVRDGQYPAGRQNR
jgi:hypothetical protein